MLLCITKIIAQPILTNRRAIPITANPCGSGPPSWALSCSYWFAWVLWSASPSCPTSAPGLPPTPPLQQANPPLSHLQIPQYRRRQLPSHPPILHSPHIHPYQPIPPSPQRHRFPSHLRNRPCLLLPRSPSG